MCLLVLPLIQAGYAIRAQPVGADAVETVALIERLRKTNLSNGYEIYEQLMLSSTNTSRTFVTANPYGPRYQEVIERFEGLKHRLPENSQSYALQESKRRFTFLGQKPVFEWYRSLSTNTQVCAIRFSDNNQTDYELRTFPTANAALAKDYVITHRYHCGTCSSLQNLAVYLAKPDLISPTRTCARKMTLNGIKKCLMESVRFEEQCSDICF